MITTASTLYQIQKICTDAKKQGKTIALVPTMGYLHEGHLSLVKKARELSDFVVVSIYVNPFQFAPGEDLDTYPRDFEQDKKLLTNAKVDCIFFPTDSTMYPEGYKTRVMVEQLSHIMCGESRPTHFMGATTIVLKLFNIIAPDYAVFGLKDYQQFVIIKTMVKDLNVPVKIYGSPTIREKDGLAMSSRNSYLSQDQRLRAVALWQSLQWGKTQVLEKKLTPEQVKQAIKNQVKESKAKVDYVYIANADNLKPLTTFNSCKTILIAIAAFYGKTRLIDNIVIEYNKTDY